jgi:hypothetical protein
MENILINFVSSFILFLLSMVYLSGFWRNYSLYNFDQVIFPKQNTKILKYGDKLAFLICITMSLFTLINGLLMIYFPSIHNVSAIFIFVGIFLTWPIRIIFIYIKGIKGRVPERE